MTLVLEKTQAFPVLALEIEETCKQALLSIIFSRLL